MQPLIVLIFIYSIESLRTCIRKLWQLQAIQLVNKWKILMVKIMQRNRFLRQVSKCLKIVLHMSKKNPHNPPVVYILHMIIFFPTTAKYSPADSLCYSCILVLWVINNHFTSHIFRLPIIYDLFCNLEMLLYIFDLGPPIICLVCPLVNVFLPTLFIYIYDYWRYLFFPQNRVNRVTTGWLWHSTMKGTPNKIIIVGIYVQEALFIFWR